MNTSAWIVTALIAAFGIARLVGTFSPAQRRERAEAFARSIGLAMPHTLSAVITERVALRHRGSAIGLVAGIVTSATALSVVPGSSDNFATPFLLIGGAFAGQAVGVAVSASRAAAALDADAVKYARLTAVTLDDYVAPLERGIGRVVTVVGVLATVAAIAAKAEVSGVLIALCAVGVVAQLFFEVAGRRIVARSQPAHSPDDLAWDDAVRSSVLRDMITAPIILGADAAVVAAGAFVDHVLAGADIARIAIVVVCTLAAIGLAVAAVRSRPQQHFLLRLWPKAAA